MINWSQLKPYRTTKQKSFEQLCYQVAVKLFEPQGRFTPIDDSGGGDGIEFYLTLPSGEVWGWQAKFYDGSPRLKESNRKKAISGSLERALEIHPALTRWYLCLPLNFTPDEQKWVDKTLPSFVPADLEVEIIPWPESFFHEKLNQPAFNGLRQAFFNTLELSPDWFRQAFERSFALVRHKFDARLYVPNYEFLTRYTDPAMITPDYLKVVRLLAEGIRENYEASATELFKLQDQQHEAPDFYRPFLAIVKPYRDTWVQLFADFDRLLTPGSAELLLDAYQTFTRQRMDALYEMMSDAYDQTILLITGQDERYPELAQGLTADAQQFYSSHFTDQRQAVNQADVLFDKAAQAEERQIVHILGRGGSGKTNLCVAIAYEETTQHRPAIFIPAARLIGDQPLTEQLLRLLDIHQHYTFTDLLDTLNTLGRIYQVRVPIIIDGLNEAVTSSGRFNVRLKLDLPQLEHDIRSRPYLSLITTCRATYREAIWSASPGSAAYFAEDFGFNSYDDQKALVKKYFQQYHIQGDLYFVSLRQFGHPLYLKLFCETMHAPEGGVRQVTLGHDTIYQVFDQYISLSDRQAYGRLLAWGAAPLPQHRKLVSGTLRQLAAYLWEHQARVMPFDVFLGFTGLAGTTDFNYSPAKAILEDDLIFTRDLFEEQDQISVTYDVLAGYLIAAHLLDSYPDTPQLIGSGILRPGDPGKLAAHPLNDDIFKALCTLLPVQRGEYLHELIRPFLEEADEEVRRHWQELFNESLRATMVLAPESISVEQRAFVRELALWPGNFIPALGNAADVLFVAGHPFNFNLFDELLAGMSLVERDRTWSDHVRYDRGQSLSDVLQEFEELRAYTESSAARTEKIGLVVNYFCWLLSTPDRGVKRSVANALYQFGREQPAQFFPYYYRAAGWNDPSIYQWLSLVAYNLILEFSRQRPLKYQQVLRQTAQHLLSQHFGPEALHPTNHLIIRDYSFRSLTALRKVLPDLHGQIDLEAIRKNFKNQGVLRWQFAVDRDKGQYRDGNSLIHHQFEKNRMYPVGGGGTEYNPNATYNKRLGWLRWRAYALGYTLEAFGEIDKRLAAREVYETEDGKFTRFADKYIDIAYQELCGYLADRGKLESFESDGYMRLEEPFLELEAPAGEQLPPPPSLILADYLNRGAGKNAWVNDTSTPDFLPYLNRTAIPGKAGNWQLLFGNIGQVWPEGERRIFFYIQAYLLPAKKLAAVWKDFNAVTQLGRGSTTPFTSYVHEQEKPDGDIIPRNKGVTWTYANKKIKVTHTYVERQLFQDGRRLAPEEEESTFQAIAKMTGRMSAERIRRAGFPEIIVQIHGEPKRPDLVQAAAQLGLTIREVQFLRIDEENNRKSLTVLHPFRNIQNTSYLSKNLIDHFALSRLGPGPDLYDLEGRLASFNHNLTKSYDDQEEFLYLRKDLLDRYLAESGLKMVYVLWGERDFYPRDGDWMKIMGMASQRKWADLYEAIHYTP